jgi:phosphohistidine phosphatase
MAEPELLLLRHGIAEDRPVHPLEDPHQALAQDRARCLTERGRRRSRAVLERLVALGLSGDRLISSPFERALETAALAVEVGLAPALETATALAPGGDPGPLLAAPSGRLILVGHEPDLSALACRLIGAADGSLVLRKAGAILLSLGSEPGTPGSGGGAQLRLLLSPRALLG